MKNQEWVRELKWIWGNFIFEMNYLFEKKSPKFYVLKRLNVINEILQTEKSYLKNLKNIIEVIYFYMCNSMI